VSQKGEDIEAQFLALVNENERLRGRLISLQKNSEKRETQLTSELDELLKLHRQSGSPTPHI
jgi:hypothetical protein